MNITNYLKKQRFCRNINTLRSKNVEKKMTKNVLINEQIVYELAIETTKIMIKKQKELQNISWTNGESNLDT
jgi:hypothetical protein